MPAPAPPKRSDKGKSVKISPMTKTTECTFPHYDDKEIKQRREHNFNSPTGWGSVVNNFLHVLQLTDDYCSGEREWVDSDHDCVSTPLR